MSVPARPIPMFTDIDDVAKRLAATGYLPDTATATAVFLADRLGKPLLVEGPAGVGKTELARAVAQATDSGLVRLQCYEGVDEARALYEWNHAKQILRIQTGNQGGQGDWDQTKMDVFSEEFLLTRPLLTAIKRTEPTVLLIDETDKADIEIEGLLLEVLSDFAVTVPELGTITATRQPFVLLTSNATRELSDALRRRCLYHYLDFPDVDREAAILLNRQPSLDVNFAFQIAHMVGMLRKEDLKKVPGVAETLDWAATLAGLDVKDLHDDPEIVHATLIALLKTREDRAYPLERHGAGPREMPQGRSVEVRQHDADTALKGYLTKHLRRRDAGVEDGADHARLVRDGSLPAAGLPQLQDLNWRPGVDVGEFAVADLLPQRSHHGLSSAAGSKHQQRPKRNPFRRRKGAERCNCRKRLRSGFHPKRS